jgi:chromosome segregation ATPase
MDISNGSGGIDSSKLMDYFTKDFLKDLGKMAVLRDELAKRQGAMSAVEDAAKLRAEAEAYAASKKAEIDGALEEAKETSAKSKAQKADLDARETDIDAKAKALAIADAAFNNSVAAKKQSLANEEAALLKAQNELKLAQDKLASDQATLDARVKAFQAKVASIAV